MVPERGRGWLPSHATPSSSAGVHSPPNSPQDDRRPIRKQVCALLFEETPGPRMRVRDPSSTHWADFKNFGCMIFLPGYASRLARRGSLPMAFHHAQAKTHAPSPCAPHTTSRLASPSPMRAVHNFQTGFPSRRLPRKWPPPRFHLGHRNHRSWRRNGRFGAFRGGARCGRLTGRSGPDWATTGRATVKAAPGTIVHGGRGSQRP